MPDSLTLGAGEAILKSGDGVLGAVVILLIGALLFATRRWLSALAAKDAVQELRLAEVREFAKISEDLRNVMSANTVAIKSVLDLYQRERDRH